MDQLNNSETRKFPLKLDLQFFAAEGEEGQGGTGDDGQQPPQTITLTEQELQLKLQQESDRRVTEALKKFEEKKALEFESRLKTEREEAEKLAKMTQEERFKLERDKELAKFEEDRQALEDERMSFQKERLFVETEKVLVSESLPPSFAPFLIADDAEKTNANIQAFKTAFNEAVQQQANAALGGKVPPGGSGKQLSELDQLYKDHAQAVQSNNMALAISLKNKIHSLQK
jgi:ribosome-binding ATPase YchF (GTP1/OBG family)